MENVLCNAGIERERAIRINILYFETLVETSLQRLEEKVRFILITMMILTTTLDVVQVKNRDINRPSIHHSEKLN